MSLWDFCQGLTDFCPKGCHSARVIYLIGASLCFSTPAAYPPAMDEQPIVTKSIKGCHAPVYMALQPIRRAACRVTTTSGGLLPHLFTIACFPGPCGTELLAGCYFLSRYSAVADSSLLESMVLCVARTFLLPLRRSTSISKRHKRPATVGKDTNKIQKLCH